MPKKYTIKSGDSLYGISKKYNIPLDELLKRNKNISTRTTFNDGGEIELDGGDDFLKGLYSSDLKRVMNGDRAIYFGHLNDKPLINEYPEFIGKIPINKKHISSINSAISEDMGDILSKTANSVFDVLDIPNKIGKRIHRFGRKIEDSINPDHSKFDKYTRTLIGKFLKSFGKRREMWPALLVPEKYYMNQDEADTVQSFSDAFRDAENKGLKEFEWNGERYKVERKEDGGKVFSELDITPSEKRIREIVNMVNSSDANFVKRLKQKNRAYLNDWEHEGSIATHKMAVEIDEDGKTYMYPMVQEINGYLHDFTNPRYNAGNFDALRFAKKNNDVVEFDDILEALWFSENYKNLGIYPKFENGGSVSEKSAEQNLKEERETRDWISGWLEARKDILGKNARVDEEFESPSSKSDLEFGEDEYKRQMGQYDSIDRINYDVNGLPVDESKMEFLRSTVRDYAGKNIENDELLNEELKQMFEGFVSSPDSDDRFLYFPKYPTENIRTHENTHTLVYRDPVYGPSTAQSRRIADRMNAGESLMEGVEYDDYIDDANEIYSRLMEFRRENNLDPKKKYTKDDIKGLREKYKNKNDDNDSYGVIDRYNDDFLLFLLNDIAENNQGDEDIFYAKDGGNKSKYGISIMPPYSDNSEYIEIENDGKKYYQIYKDGEDSIEIKNGSNSSNRKNIDRLFYELMDSGKGVYINGKYLIPKSTSDNEYKRPIYGDDGKIDWEAFEQIYKNMDRASGGPRDLNKDNLKIIENYLDENNISNKDKWVILGNIIDETGGNPRDVSKSGEFYGLFQWSKKLYDENRRKSDKNKSNKDLIIDQMDYFFDNIGERNHWARGKFSDSIYSYPYKSKNDITDVFLSRSGDLWDKNNAFVNGFERTKDRGETIIDRYNTARILQDGYNDLDSMYEKIESRFHESDDMKKYIDINRFSSLTKMNPGGDIKEKVKLLYNKLKDDAGMSDILALGVIGNLWHESGGLKEDAVGDTNTSDHAYGIQQWRGDRKKKLFEFAKNRGHEKPTYEDEVDFLIEEFNTGNGGFLYGDKGKSSKAGYYNYSKNDFLQSGSLSDAVVSWNLGSGRPHKDFIANDSRLKYAEEAAKILGVRIPESESHYGNQGYNPDGVDMRTYMAQTPEQPATFNVNITAEMEDNNFDDWMNTYGKEMIASMYARQNEADEKSVEEERLKKAMKEEEERIKAEQAEKRQREALIAAILPNLQLNIKGMSRTES